MKFRASSSARFASVVALLLALVAAPKPTRAWDPAGSQITFQPGTQSDPLVLPSGSIVYADSESIRVWISVATPGWSFWAPPPSYGSQRVSQGGGSAGRARAIDYLEHSVLAVWSDDRNGAGNADIFVQRIGPDGIWPSFIWDGIPVCTADSAQIDPSVVDDGAGGFFVAWSDRRNAASGADIYVQHYYEYGGIWDGWPIDGIRICDAAGDQVEPALVADGMGGAIAVWRDLRSGDSDLYARGIGSTGVSPPAWGASGLAICAAAGEQDRPVVLPDGSGGAYVAWRDRRLTIPLPFVTRIQKDGAIAAGWAPNGTIASTNSSQPAASFSLCPADSGGVLLAWNWANTPTDLGTSLQRLGAEGTVRWGPAGVQVGAGAAIGTAPAVMSDGAGGAFAAWSATGTDGVDLRAVRLDSMGVSREFWPFDGISVCDAAGDQLLPDWRSGGSPGGPIFPDGNGGFIVVWTDTRVPDNVDLYAQRVTRNGVVAPELPRSCFECAPPSLVRQVYPNPTRGSVSIQSWVPENGIVLIDVIDVQGRSRGTRRVANLPGGSFMNVPVDMMGLPTGVYFLRVRIEGGPRDAALGTRRVVLIR